MPGRQGFSRWWVFSAAGASLNDGPGRPTYAPAGKADYALASSTTPSPTSMENAKKVTQSSRWERSDYQLILSAGVGMFFGYSQVIIYTFGIFLPVFVEEFHWSRGVVSAALSISLLSYSAVLPIVGRAVDRVGARQIALASLSAYSLFLLILAVIPGRLWLFYLVFILLGVVSSGTNSMPYLRIVTVRFREKSALPIALVASGAGISGLVMPSAAYYLLSSAGWRVTYGVLGVLVILIAIPLVYFFLHNGAETSSEGIRSPLEEGADFDRQGLQIGEVFRRPGFWMLVTAYASMFHVVVGCLSHLVTLSTDRGFSAETAALALSVLTGTTLLGRPLIGVLLNRFSAALTLTVVFALTGLGVYLLRRQDSPAAVFAGASLLGFGFSTDATMPYLISRYFGSRSFGEIYGWAGFISFLGATSGPLFMGYAYDYFGSYELILQVYNLTILLAAVLLAIALNLLARRKPAGASS